jgi:hypothetical protein
LALNTAGWIATAAGVWVLLDGIAGPAPDPAWLGGSHAFAWMLGFIVPFLPGGLGLRDGTPAAFWRFPTQRALARRSHSRSGWSVCSANSWQLASPR